MSDDDASPTDDGAPTNTPRRARRRAVKWIGGVLAAGLAGTVTAFMTYGAHGVAHLFDSSAAPAPLIVTASLESPLSQCFGATGWVFPQRRQDLPLPTEAEQEDRDLWARAHGGEPASGNYVVVDLQGRAPHTVIVTALHVRIVARHPPPHGTYPQYTEGCGGLTPSLFSANLDSVPVKIKPIKSSEGPHPNVPPVPLPHVISEGRPEVWHIQATTEKCACAWEASIDWISDGRRGSSPVNDEGRPFYTDATSDSQKVEARGSGGWTPIDAPGLVTEPANGGSITHEVSVAYTDAPELDASTHTAHERLVLLAQAFPFDKPYVAVAYATTTQELGATFTPHPALATRYRVAPLSKPFEMSEPVTVYVYNKLTTRCVRGCEPREGRRGQRTEMAFSLRAPPHAQSIEAAKRVFIYYGIRRGSRRPPHVLSLVTSVLPSTHPGGWRGGRFQLQLKRPLHQEYAYTLRYCTSNSYSTDGLGMPDEPRCGTATYREPDATERREDPAN